MSEWISRSWNSDPGRRSVAFITTGNQFQAERQKEFRNAILTATQVDVGEAREPMNEPGKIEFPNLKISINAASAGTWQDWFQDFVIEGNNGAGGERRGTLEFLSPDRRQVLAAIEFTGLGIFRLAEALDPNDAVTRYAADLCCGKMAFIPGKPGLFNQ